MPTRPGVVDKGWAKVGWWSKLGRIWNCFTLRPATVGSAELGTITRSDEPTGTAFQPKPLSSRAHIKSFFSKKNATLPLALCLWGLRRWHYGGISGIFGRIQLIFSHYKCLHSLWSDCKSDQTERPLPKGGEFYKRQNPRQITCKNPHESSTEFEPSRPFLGFRWAENGVPFDK